MDFDERLEKMRTAAEVFSPSAPIDQKALFSGRMEQILNVCNAVAQRGQHVILYGERGVGKTSLATVISRMFDSDANLLACGSVNCDKTTTFSSLWHKVFREMPASTAGPQGEAVQTLDGENVVTLAGLLPTVVTPDDVRHVLQRLGKTIIVIDELDRIEDTNATTLLADTVKNLSDHSVDTTLILVGVADSVEALIGEHQSVDRALVQIRMPRMEEYELIEIIEKGCKHTGMEMEPTEKRRIAQLSQGLPHYTHLLALHAFQAAVQRDDTTVTHEDVRAAIDKALSQAQQTTVGAYHRATSSPRENLYPQVLLACALADADNLGFFAAADVREPMSRIMGKAYDIPAFSQHLNAFCESARGPVLQRTGVSRRYRFRFLNPLMQPYVVLHGINKKLIEEDQIGKKRT